MGTEDLAAVGNFCFAEAEGIANRIENPATAGVDDPTMDGSETAFVFEKPDESVANHRSCSVSQGGVKNDAVSAVFVREPDRFEEAGIQKSVETLDLSSLPWMD